VYRYPPRPLQRPEKDLGRQVFGHSWVTHPQVDVAIDRVNVTTVQLAEGCSISSLSPFD
jgi:hypothetical protein